jgi:hypothetical protein
MHHPLYLKILNCCTQYSSRHSMLLMKCDSFSTVIKSIFFSLHLLHSQSAYHLSISNVSLSLLLCFLSISEHIWPHLMVFLFQFIVYLIKCNDKKMDNSNLVLLMMMTMTPTESERYPWGFSYVQDFFELKIHISCIPSINKIIIIITFVYASMLTLSDCFKEGAASQ